MQFRTSHLFLFTGVVALALVFRAISVETANDRIVSTSAFCVSILITATMTLMGDSRRLAIACGITGAFAILISHLGECWMQTAATEYVWHGPQYWHYRDLYVISCIAVLFGCAIIAWVVSRLVEWLARNANTTA